MWTARDNRVFLPVMLALVALAWLSLALWGLSPWSRYLHHHSLVEIDLRRNGNLLFVFVGGWTLMTVAMMLPTSLPLIALFRRMTTRRPDGVRLVTLLIAGYLAVWTLFGFAAYLADLGIHQIVSRSPAFSHHEWVIGAGVLLLAGAYQFTPLKYHCLDACRSPLSFISARWRGRDEARQSLLLGIHHGVFCVGCCWSLMLVMFVVGMGSLFWMLLLGGVMAVEKNMPWGRQLSAPLGAGLISGAAAISLLALV
jgi:predicted metal-binding membrane protein